MTYVIDFRYILCINYCRIEYGSPPYLVTISTTDVETDRCHLFGYFLCTNYCRIELGSPPSQDMFCTTDVQSNRCHLSGYFLCSSCCNMVLCYPPSQDMICTTDIDYDWCHLFPCHFLQCKYQTNFKIRCQNQIIFLQLFHSNAHKSYLWNLITNHYQITTMSANWEIWMFDYDGPNQFHAAMTCLDKEMGNVACAQ